MNGLIEFDLFDSLTITEAFQKGGLINSASSVDSQDVDRLLRIFILKRVMFVPGSHVSQDRQKGDAMAFSMLSEQHDQLQTPTVIYN